MKVLHVIPHLGSGGAERLTVDLCNRLDSLGHEVVICVLYPLEGRFSFYANQLSSSIRLYSLNKRKGAFTKACIQMWKLIRREKPDLVHTHLWALPYTFLSELLFVKGVHTVHSEANVEATNLLNKLVRIILFRTGRVKAVSVSRESHESFIRFYGIKPVLINNGRDIPNELVVTNEVRKEIDKYKSYPDSKVIVHLAHIDSVKRQLLHARVAKRLFDEGYRFTVLFIGSTAKAEYVAKVREAMPPCAFILGEKSNPLEYLKESGAFALCSQYEGLPISFLEALGVGAIPICMPLGGIPEIIVDGENGLLSNGLEENDFYAIYKRFLELTEGEAQIMRAKALESFKPYDMSTCVQKYLQLYRQIVHPSKN